MRTTPRRKKKKRVRLTTHEFPGDGLLCDLCVDPKDGACLRDDARCHPDPFRPLSSAAVVVAIKKKRKKEKKRQTQRRGRRREGRQRQRQRRRWRTRPARQGRGRKATTRGSWRRPSDRSFPRRTPRRGERRRKTSRPSRNVFLLLLLRPKQTRAQTQTPLPRRVVESIARRICSCSIVARIPSSNSPATRQLSCPIFASSRGYFPLSPPFPPSSPSPSSSSSPFFNSKKKKKVAHIITSLHALLLLSRSTQYLLRYHLHLHL